MRVAHHAKLCYVGAFAMARILVIEDNPDLRQMLQYELGAAGHHVRVAATGGEGLRQARDEAPDIVLLDLLLPDMPGTNVCTHLKSDPVTRATRVIIVSAKGEEIDRVVGFELGAEDYVVKPFSVRELVLRIHVVMGRAQAPEPASPIAFGSLRLDRDACRAWVDDEEVPLTMIEFRLLVTLTDRRNRVQSRRQIVADVWGAELNIEARTVDTHVRRLRDKLGSAGRYIQTVRGVGYRFAADPEEGGEGAAVQ
jgi:two-component system, OmpR family, phosphate regulon response regulator PhoB